MSDTVVHLHLSFCNTAVVVCHVQTAQHSQALAIIVDRSAAVWSRTYLLHDWFKHETVALIIHPLLQGDIDTVVPPGPHPHILN